MDNNEFIKINKNGWDNLIKSNKPFSNTILPNYGPFLEKNEEDISLLNNLKGTKILDFGCGDGESLEYLYNKGASEVWGIDISRERIDKAKKRFPMFKNNFFLSPMENEVQVPNNYFDYIISIFSIGYTSNLLDTFKNAYKYLNNNGSLIISWTHPFYYCLDVVNDEVIVNKPYFDEKSEIITKGPDKIHLAQNNLMICTIINTAVKVGFYVDTMLEEKTIVNGYNSDFWRKEKIVKCPSTLVLRLIKK